MSYYFPLGGSSAISIQNVSHSLLAVTASVPVATTITAETALFATTSGSNPPAGDPGYNAVASNCDSTLLISGSTGPQGPSGSNGADNVTCPPETIQCTQASVSLSGAFPSYPNGLNGGLGGSNPLPSGSQYSIVCMEIPIGCTGANTICPPYLPIAYPQIV